MSNEKPLVAVLDLETTGIVKPIGICQIAMAIFDPMAGTIESVFQTYCKPSHPMTAKALETHGITPEYYANAPTDKMAVWAADTLVRQIEYPTILSGYNSDRYDYPIMRDVMSACPAIATYLKLDVMRLALRRDNGQSYKLVDVFEQMGLGETEEGQALLSGAHDAMADVLMTSMVLRQFMRERETDDVRDLLKELETPKLLELMPHGKYRGIQFKEVRADYLTWAASAWDDMSEDLRFTFKHYGLL